LEGLKQKALNGAKWSLLEQVINIGFEFAIGIVLARLLMPTDFGTIAVISVIVTFSSIFVNSGFSQSLVRDPEVGNKDFSTVFFFNLAVGIFFYFVIFFLSTRIANFYENNELTLYVKVLGLSIFISSLTLVQRVNLIREMNFKLISKITIASSLSSGIIALGMALSGFGIWSLIAKTLSREIIQSILFWISNKWKPSSVFESSILKKHFRYGSNFLLSAIIGQLYNNVSALTIGKVFDLQTLGYYNRAQIFSNIISVNFANVLTGVSFPVLSKVQNDKGKFVSGVRLLLRQAFFVIGILMTLVFFSAKVFIPFLLGSQWEQAGKYVQFLSVIGFFGVLNSILVNSLSVTGKSNIYLYLGIWTLCLNIISLIFAYFFGIEVMLTVLIVFNFFSYLLISHVFNRFFRYSILDQWKDYKSLMKVVVPTMLIGIIFSFFESSMFMVLFMVVTKLAFIFTISSWLRIEEFEIIKKLILKKR